MTASPIFTINTIDVHAEGEPGRVILSDGLGIRGDDMSARLSWCADNLEWLRRLLLHEPRGYPATCAVIVTPPVRPGSDAGIVILEQGGFRPMSGSNTICAVTALLESGVLPAQEPTTTLRLDTAAGTVSAVATVDGRKVTSVQVHNVPSFVVALDVPIKVEGVGTVPSDIAFGGQFYVQARADAIGIQLGANNGPAIAHAAMGLLAAAREQVAVQHPLQPELDQIGLVMLHGPAVTPGTSGRNSVVLPTCELDASDPSTWHGALDRSPCGTGTSARMACLHARGRLALGEPFIHEGVLGTTFTGRLHDTLQVGNYEAVLPSIQGRGWVTARTHFELDPTDPFQDGYMIPDIWGSTDVPTPEG